MDLDAIRKAYGRYAHLYDFYFGPILSPGRKVVIDKMDCRPGDRVLEVGVGTGLSLPLYPRTTQVVGIDLCAEMLEQARERTQKHGLTNVTGLEVMDAEDMRLEDASFDKVVAMYVASVVPSPRRLVDEMRRVCRPGGEMFIVNHFHHDNPLIGGVERMIAPLSRLFGWHPDFDYDAFVRDTELDVRERMQVNLFGYWTLLRASPRRASTARVVAARKTA